MRILILPTETSTYSSSRAFTFQLRCHFSLRLQRLGPAQVTPNSALLFNKKGAQHKEQARKGEGRGREGGRAKGEEKAREKGSKVTGHSLAFHSDYHTLPYPCNSEMLIKGHFPESPHAG